MPPGDIVYIPTYGTSIMILGSSKAIFELLDKRSAVTSSRRDTPMRHLDGIRDEWRRHRRAFWQHFTPNATKRYLAIQSDFAHMFARKLLSDPSGLKQHVRYTFAGAIVKVAYGFTVGETNDKYITLMEKVTEGLQAFVPGRYLVEFLPIVRFVPPWMPGARFHQDFAVWRGAADEARKGLYLRTKQGLESGETSQSVLAKLLETVGDEGHEREIAENVCMVAFEGGADTTYSTLQSFFLAMSLSPEIQHRAQAELHSVVGPDRLPTHDDRPALPYVNAIIKESLRWQNVLPLGVHHTTTEDTVYDGYFIPKGTMLFPNTWTCLHDPEVFPDPDRFWPERFLGPDGQLDPAVRDPSKYTFGYGRRICPGKHFADASLFINMATVLHVFDISPPPDEDGKPVRIEPRMTNGIMSYPEDCRCTVTPRSQRARELILEDH
ncbi:CyP450 monooxygenase [Epithele typhae]|uniref:CyP450 monooxygenase n=1 Tax=Epithele typhae TaxID=378194 RepID=UPI002008D050|nr:CyP450 monooxygenase [Epithele typhae]KAH9924289.1 CyP450 monooxygenase [Epithele typhae]